MDCSPFGYSVVPHSAFYCAVISFWFLRILHSIVRLILCSATFFILLCGFPDLRLHILLSNVCFSTVGSTFCILLCFPVASVSHSSFYCALPELKMFPYSVFVICLVLIWFSFVYIGYILVKLTFSIDSISWFRFSNDLYLITKLKCRLDRTSCLIFFPV